MEGQRNRLIRHRYFDAPAVALESMYVKNAQVKTATAQSLGKWATIWRFTTAAMQATEDEESTSVTVLSAKNCNQSTKSPKGVFKKVLIARSMHK